MSTALTIATPFADFSELSENFAQRVDAERLMLPYAEPVAEGEWVSFVVTYADGSTALSGAGRCQGSYDNGEEHPPEYRYDVVVDSLQIEGAGEVMFERLVMARNSQMGEANAEPATGEVSLDALEAEHAAAQAAAAAVPHHAVEDAGADAVGDDAVADAVGDAGADDAVPDDAIAAEAVGEEAFADDAVAAEAVGDDTGWEEPQAPTAIANLGELAAGSVRSQPPPRPIASERPAARAAAPGAPRPAPGARPGRASAPAALPSPHTFNGTVLTRPTQPAAWTPEAMERPEAAASSGLFDYGRTGLPKPALPPRPELAPEQRVELAPAPGRPARRAAPASVAPAARASEPPSVDGEALDETNQYDIPSDDDAEA